MQSGTMQTVMDAKLDVGKDYRKKAVEEQGNISSSCNEVSA